MKLAKNNKSVFFNLYEVLSSLSENESSEFEKSLFKARKKTKQNYLFDFLISRIKEGEVINNDNEGILRQKSSIKADTTNINRLTENLYKSLLSFLAEKYKSDKWKAWQVEANKHLMEIEALCAREKYTQAIAHLLKLEEKLISQEPKKKWIYDDRGIYSRVASLKVQLLNIAKQFFEPDEIDETLHHLLMLGEYFYFNGLNINHVPYTEKHKFLGNQILSQFFLEQEKYHEAIEQINHRIKETEKQDFEYELQRTIVLQHLWMKKLHIASLMNDVRVFHDFNNNSIELSPIATVMLQENIQSSIVTPMMINMWKYEGIDNDIISYHYTSDVIADVPLRIEINQTIVLYLSGQFKESLSLVRDLKPKLNGKKFYKAALFIEVFNLLRDDPEAEIDNVIRNLLSLIKKNKEANEFELKAIQIFQEWSKRGKDYPKLFREQNQDILHSLDEIASKNDVIHNIIISILQGKI